MNGAIGVLDRRVQFPVGVKKMKRLVLSFLMVAVLLPEGAMAGVCGDVTGDGRVNSTDALRVLQSAVGLDVPLDCEGNIPSRIRYASDWRCGDGSSAVSVMRFDDVQLSASPGEPSDYVVVDGPTLGSITIELCGGTIDFGGWTVPKGTDFTGRVQFLDPSLHCPGEDLCPQLVFYIDELRDAETSDFEAGTPMSVSPLSIRGTIGEGYPDIQFPQ